MAKIITMREANQSFVRCIRDVEAGGEYVITRNGAPVARLIPVVGRRVISPAKPAALTRTYGRMEKGWPLGAGLLDRDGLHER